MELDNYWPYIHLSEDGSKGNRGDRPLPRAVRIVILEAECRVMTTPAEQFEAELAAALKEERAVPGVMA